MDTPTSMKAFKDLRHLPNELRMRFIKVHSTAHAELDAPALWQSRDEIPPQLLAAIHDLHQMSSETGFLHIVDAARRHGCALAKDVRPVVAVALLLLEQPSVFRRALARHTIEATRPFYELVGRLFTPPRDLEVGHQAIERHLRTFFVERDQGDHCTMMTWQDGHLLCFLVRHGKGRQVSAQISGTEVVTHDFWPATDDLVVFDARLAHLRIGVRNADVREEYRRRFGEWLYDDPGWFTSGPAINLDPLLSSPDRALSPTTGLQRVRVASITVSNRGPHGGELSAIGDDALAALLHRGVTPEPGDVRSVQLDLLHASDGRWRPVALTVPDRIITDWRSDNVVMRRFLEERGFVTGPPPLPHGIRAPMHSA